MIKSIRDKLKEEVDTIKEDTELKEVYIAPPKLKAVEVPYAVISFARYQEENFLIWDAGNQARATFNITFFHENKNTEQMEDEMLDIIQETSKLFRRTEGLILWWLVNNALPLEITADYDLSTIPKRIYNINLTFLYEE